MTAPLNPTLELAQALLARPSITPDDQGCQAILAQRLQALGFEITPITINKVTNLWAKRGNQQPTVCFAGHTDVVPPGELTQWHSPPFEPTIQNARLTARGAADMKSSLAAMIIACERFLKQHPEPAGSIAFLITSDEEGEALDGTAAVLRLLKAQNLLPEFCLVGEASSEKTLGDTIKIGRRGSLTGTVKILGKQGHVAYPHLAHNPIHLAFAPFKALSEYVWDEAVHPFPATTLQFANIRSGTGTNNVIPGVLEADFNLRFSPQTSAEKIKTITENFFNQYACPYEIQWRLSAKPFYTPIDSPFVRAVVDSVKKIMGAPPVCSTAGGTSDGRFFAEYGIPVVELGPVNESVHQVNEWIEVEALETLSRLYEEILGAVLVSGDSADS